MGEPREISLLGSLELPDFDGAFWFDKLDELGVGDLPGASLASATPPHGVPVLDVQEKVVVPLPLNEEVVVPLDLEEPVVPIPLEEGHDPDSVSDPESYDPLRDASPPPQKRRRGRGRAKSNLTLEDKRAKNREIQARYRAKQKKEKEALEATCNEVSHEIDAAMREHVIAKHSNEIMEKVLVIRDAAVGILAKGSTNKNQPSSVSKDSDDNLINATKNPNCVLEEMRSSDVTSGGGNGNGNGSGSWSGSGSGSGSGGVSRPVVQEVYKNLSTDAGIPLRSIAEAYDAGKKLDAIDIEEIAAKNPCYPELVETVRNMTGNELTESWRTFALQLKQILDAYEEEEEETLARPAASNIKWNIDKTALPKVMEQIEPLFEEQVTIFSTALRHNLPAVQALFNTTGEVGPDPDSFWQSVAEQMEITPKQRQSFISLWKAYESRLASLKEQRNDMLNSLMQAAGLGGDGYCNGNGGGNGAEGVAPTAATAMDVGLPLPVDTLNAMMNRYCTLFDATGNVAATPDNELTALLDLMRAAGNVWSLYQKAKMTALSYPSFPDIVHFLKSIASGQENTENGAAVGVAMLE